MTFGQEFLLIHVPRRGMNHVYKRRVVYTETRYEDRLLEKVVSSYYASKVLRTAQNFRGDWTVVQCGKYGKIEIVRK